MPEPPHPPQPPQLRIGHAERDRTVEELRQAAGLGRIDLDELEERVERALVARTQRELDALVTDLRPVASAPPLPPFPPLAPPAPPAPPPPPSAYAVGAPGYRQGDPLVLAAGASSVKRAGTWELPPFVKISPAFGSVRIDCLAAVVRSLVVQVQVVGSMGSTTFIVPRGWAADVDRLKPGLGSVRNKLDRAAAPGCPTLVLRGWVGVGSVTLRHPNFWETRASRRERH